MTGAEDSDFDPRIGSMAAGKYRIARLIGRGAMGSVYEALHVALGKRVALKFVTAPFGAGPRSLSRFHREARAIAAIESAHIVQIFDTGETEAGEPFLVMELLQGESLAERIAAAGPLPIDEVVRLVVQVLRGLRRAHAAGIVHRDLKPENILLVKGEDDRPHVKIVDFGLSKVLSISEDSSSTLPSGFSVSLTQEGDMLGTPLYMSPEQIEGRADVDHRSDLWSVGAILFEALSGHPPFPETSYARLVNALFHRSAPDVSKVAPGVPAALAAVVTRALTRERPHRFQSADEMLAAIVAALPGLDRAAVLPSSPGLRAPTSATARKPSSTGIRPLAADGVRSLAADLDGEPTFTDSGGSARPPPSDAAAAGSAGDRAPAAELRTYTASGATLWLTQSPAFSIWRGEVAAPDRLRIEERDGSLHELRLEPVGLLRLGRAERVGAERNELVYREVASRLAATLRHDGVRWWLRRREECSVPVQVGARALARGEEAPLVHGTFLSVGGMRATLVDRRYVAPTVPAGTVDPATGLLGRVGIEQECASLLQRKRSGALVLMRPSGDGQTLTPASDDGAGLSITSRASALTVALHRAWPDLAVGLTDGVAVLLASGTPAEVEAVASRAAEVARSAAVGASVCGLWTLAGEGVDAGREIELALHAIASAADPGPGAEGARRRPGAPNVNPSVLLLREVTPSVRLAGAPELLAASGDARRATLLFGIEEQTALGSVGPHVISALSQELAAVVASYAGDGALVTTLAPGVVAACVARRIDVAAMASAVQCDWHARPPVVDGKVELARTLSWELLHGANVATRAMEISRECADPHGVLSALSGGLPYPIAGRVHAAIAASSAIERVKMLFDVLEGTWRFIASVLVSAFFNGGRGSASPAPSDEPRRRPAPAVGSTGADDDTPGFDVMLDVYRRTRTRDGLALGAWREIARTAARASGEREDPIGAMARQVLDVKLSQNQTFETLSNLMQAERNAFAHGHYTEARAAADLPEFEQMTRIFLRALRPLCAWTLVTVEKTEPDLYGEVQTVEFIDHTGPFVSGTRRRIGLSSPVRLANVVYLARFREGLVLPLDPMVRRMLHEDRYDLYWMDHLPRSGMCTMSAVVAGKTLKVACDGRKVPPLLRGLMDRAG